jgi:hypothetical protein
LRIGISHLGCPLVRKECGDILIPFPERNGYVRSLIWLSAILFSGTLSRQSLLQPTLLARLQVVRVTLDFLNNVFRLNGTAQPAKMAISACMMWLGLHLENA